MDDLFQLPFKSEIFNEAERLLLSVAREEIDEKAVTDFTIEYARVFRCMKEFMQLKREIYERIRQEQMERERLREQQDQEAYQQRLRDARERIQNRIQERQQNPNLEDGDEYEDEDENDNDMPDLEDGLIHGFIVNENGDLL